MTFINNLMLISYIHINKCQEEIEEIYKAETSNAHVAKPTSPTQHSTLTSRSIINPNKICLAKPPCQKEKNLNVEDPPTTKSPLPLISSNNSPLSKLQF
jgi:hypothetical protein